jgi:PAS domain S-box-containing protein
MQSNYPEGIEDIIKTAGEQKNILDVRIYDRSGSISYASNPASVGVSIDKSSPSCKVCHGKGQVNIPPSEKERIFLGSFWGLETLAIVTPIFGKPGCYESSCHHHPPEHKALGVLEIHRSLNDVKAIVVSNIRHTVLFGFVLFGLVSSIAVFFVIRFVHRPIRNLVHSAASLSRDKYGDEVPVTSKDELGQLTTAFNRMSRKIEERQKKLVKSREQFRTLFNEVPAHIVVLDKELTIKSTNRLYREHYGERIGQRCYETLVGSKDSCEDCPAIKTFADGMVHSMERVEKHADGKEHTFLVHTASIRDEEERIEAVMEISTDVTAIKELQKELAFLGVTVAGISHTIKNILQGLEGGMHVYEIALRRDSKDLLMQGWNMVENNVKRIAGLVRDILFMSKEREPELQETDPAEVCREILQLLTDKATDTGVQIELEVPDDGRAVNIDPKGLHTVLVNLVTNAIEACREDTSSSRPHLVVLKYYYDIADGLIFFEVKDNGIGMSPATREIMFHQFYSTKGSAGTGLGLLVTKKIIEEHGGRIDVQSKQGEGTVFTVSFPIDANSVSAIG